MPVPLFPGVPGGPELLIIALILLVVVGPGILLVLLGVYFLRGGGDEDDRIEELEARIEELERERSGEPPERDAAGRDEP